MLRVAVDQLYFRLKLEMRGRAYTVQPAQLNWHCRFLANSNQTYSITDRRLPTNSAAP